MPEALEEAARLVSVAKKEHEEAANEVDRLRGELDVAFARLEAAVSLLESARQAILSVAES